MKNNEKVIKTNNLLNKSQSQTIKNVKKIF